MDSTSTHDSGKAKSQREEMEFSYQEEVILCFSLVVKHLKELGGSEEEDMSFDEGDSVKGAGDDCEIRGAECFPANDDSLEQCYVINPVAHRKFNFEQINDDVVIQNLNNDKFMKNTENTVCMSAHNLLKSARITIYFYKYTDIYGPFHGIPVVLNFTGSEKFLKCSAKDNKVFLTVECYEKQKLLQFGCSDKDCLSFLFYMKANQDGSKKFESAMHMGWFMKGFCNKVEMGPLSPENESCYFLIQSLS
ncbi:hypothetical protein GN956_G3924 [Arapaima gigas]